MSRHPPLLFYSAWGLGHHNLEAERKAVALAQEWDVTYVHGVGVRNPRVRTAGKAAAAVRRRVLEHGRRPPPAARPDLRSASLLVAPPRQLRPLRRLNAAWLARQLRGIATSWSDGVVWVRWPTPELVDALDAVRPAGLVYEAVDAYHLTPGITGPWVAIHQAAERRLLARADVVVAPGEPLASFLVQEGAAEVRLVPHGVDLFPWRGPRDGDVRREHAVIGFVGTLDYRVDVAVVRHVALARPGWRLRLIGPLGDAFDRAGLAGLANVSVEAPVPHAALGTVLAELDAGIMPYLDDPSCRYLSPVKNLEYMAAGRPAIARPIDALRPYGDLVRFATTPEGFLEQLEGALEHDGPDLARQRRRVAEAHAWDRSIRDVQRIAREAAGGSHHGTRDGQGA